MARSKQLFLISAITLVVMLWFVNAYHKWDATWGIFPVLGCGIFASILTWRGLGKLYWFQNGYSEAGIRMTIGPMLGILACLVLGISLTEPKAEDAWTHESGTPTYQYNYARTPMGRYYQSWETADVDTNSGSKGKSDVDLDGGGEGDAYLLLAVLIIIVALASAFVPHFWVVAGLVLVTVMFRVAWREHEVEKTRERFRHR